MKPGRRHHPYLRDASLRARCEKADVSRVRDLMDRSSLTPSHTSCEKAPPRSWASSQPRLNGTQMVVGCAGVCVCGEVDATLAGT